MFYKGSSFEVGQLSCELVDVQSSDAWLRFKLKIDNKSSDYYIFKGAECSIIVDGKEIKGHEKPLTIQPSDHDFKIIDFKEVDLNQHKNITLKIDGFYEVTAKGNVHQAPNFSLPPQANDFEAGPFKALMANDSRSTNETNEKFNITYTGNEVGIVSPYKASLKFVSTGTTYVNSINSRKSYLLTKGESEKITLKWLNLSKKDGDMQFCQMELVWKETFVESKASKQDAKTIELEWDEAFTKDHN